MENTEGEWSLYVFDTQTGLWHKEDDSRVTHFARCGGVLYMLNEAGEVWSVGGTEGLQEGCEEELPVDWMVEFADFTEGDPNKKSTGRMQLRMDLDPEATATVSIQYDSDGCWREIRTLYDDGEKRSWCLPVIPRRCDHYRVKIEGKGGCRIYSLAREYSPSSELKSNQWRN